MADLTFTQLLEVLEANRPFRRKWESDTRAEESLAVHFQEKGPIDLEPDDFELADGHFLSFAFDSGGRVYDIEIW